MSDQETNPTIPPEALLGHELSNAVVFFHEAVAARLGMSAAEWKCLSLLVRQGAMKASDLAALSGFTTGAITGIADRLERTGFLERVAHPTDRRSVILRLRAGANVMAQAGPIFAHLNAAMQQVAGRFKSEELIAIQRYMAETTAVLKAETYRLRKGKSTRTEDDK